MSTDAGSTAGELSLRSAARVLGIHSETVCIWFRRGVFRVWRKTPNGRVFIPRAEVIRIRDERSSSSESAQSVQSVRYVSEDRENLLLALK